MQNNRFLNPTDQRTEVRWPVDLLFALHRNPATTHLID
jgi:hypothetical protein